MAKGFTKNSGGGRRRRRSSGLGNIGRNVERRTGASSVSSRLPQPAPTPREPQGRPDRGTVAANISNRTPRVENAASTPGLRNFSAPNKNLLSFSESQPLVSMTELLDQLGGSESRGNAILFPPEPESVDPSMVEAARRYLRRLGYL